MGNELQNVSQQCVQCSNSYYNYGYQMGYQQGLSLQSSKQLLDAKEYCSQYTFQGYNIQFEPLKPEQRKEYFDKIEDLIARYRHVKNATFMGCMNTGLNIKVYQVLKSEIDVSCIDALI